MRAKRRFRQNHVLLGRDPAGRILAGAIILCGVLALYYGWAGIVASHYLAPSAPHPDDIASMGFFMATLVLIGISLVRTVDEPAGLHRIRSSKRWRRAMRR